MIELRGLSRVTRYLVWLGFGLLFLMLATLITNEQLRSLFELRPSMLDTPGRGTLIPVVLFPLTIFLLSVAWSFVLTGARHSHWIIRIGVLSLFMLISVNWLGMIVGASAVPLSIGAACLVGLVLLFVLPASRFTQAEPMFLFTLFCVGTLFATVQLHVVQQDRMSGIPIGQASLESNIQTFSSLIFPFLLLIGIELAEFTIHAAGWVTETVIQRLPGVAVYVSLIVAAGWSGYGALIHIQSHAEQDGAAGTVLAYTGALGVVVAAGLSWWLITKLAGHHAADNFATNDSFGEAIEHGLPLLVLLYVLPAMLSFAVLEFAEVVSILVLPGSPTLQSLGTATYIALNSTSDFLQSSLEPWRLIVALGSVGAALWMARRNHPALALMPRPLAPIFCGWNSPTRAGRCHC